MKKGGVRIFFISHYIIMNYNELFLSEEDIENIHTILKYSKKFSMDSVYTPIDLNIALQDVELAENQVIWTIENERLIKEIIITMEFFNSIKRNIHLSLSYIFNLHLRLILRTYNYNVELINSEILHLSNKACNKFGTCVDLSNKILVEFCGEILNWGSDDLIKGDELNLIYNSVYSYYSSHKKRSTFKNEKEIYETILLKMLNNENLSSFEVRILTTTMAKVLYNYFNPLLANPLINDLFNIFIKLLRISYPTFTEQDSKLLSTIKSIAILHKKNVFIYSENMENYIPYRHLFKDIDTIDDIKNIEF